MLYCKRLGCPYLLCMKPWVQPQCHFNQFHGTHMSKISERRLHPRPSGTTKKGFLLLPQTCLLLSCLKGRSVPCLSSYEEASVTGDSDASGKLHLRDITAGPHVSLSAAAYACTSFVPPDQGTEPLNVPGSPVPSQASTSLMFIPFSPWCEGV